MGNFSKSSADSKLVIGKMIAQPVCGLSLSPFMLGLLSSQPNHSWILLHYGKMEILRQRPVKEFDSASSFVIGNTKQCLMLFLLEVGSLAV